MQPRLWLTPAAVLFGASLLAQSAAPPSANRMRLAGTWTLDRSGPPEDEKNWRRSTGQSSPTNPTDGTGRAGGTMPRAEIGAASLSRFGETLLEPRFRTPVQPIERTYLRVEASSDRVAAVSSRRE